MKIWQGKKELSSGIEQRNEQIARELLENGSDIEFVMKITQLSEERIDQLRKELEK